MKKTKYIILAVAILAILLTVITYYLFSNKNKAGQTTSNPLPIASNGQTWTADNNTQSVTSKDSSGKTSEIDVGFPVSSLFPSPDSSSVIVEKQNTNYSPSMTFYAISSKREPKQIGQNIQSFAWISNEAYVYYQKDPNAKGQLILSSTKSAILSGLDAPTAQISSSDDFIFVSYENLTTGEDFTHLKINISTQQKSPVDAPKDKSIISVSPSGNTLILASPDATLKGIFTYNLPNGKLTELPSTPFTASIKWIDQNRFLYLKDSAEATSGDKMNTELKPDTIALYDLSTNQEKNIISGGSAQISSFTAKDASITYVTSQGDTITKHVDL